MIFKTFFSSKHPVKRMKSCRLGENFSKRSVPYKEPSKLNNKKSNNPVRTWTKDIKIHFTEENIQMAGKHVRRCSTSLTAREMQIKTVR